MFKNQRSFVRHLQILIWVSLVLLGVNACKNDVEINAPHKTLPYVFGLLNPYDTVHSIRIQRTFLGDQDPTNYSRINDSIYFKKVDAVVEEVLNGVVVQKYPLVETTITGKSTGTFSSPEQRLYQFTQSSLNPNATYRLVGTADGISLSATTALLSENDPVFGNSGPTSFGRFWNVPGFIDFATSTAIKDGLAVKFRAPMGSREIRVDMIFYYDEEFEDGRVETKNIRFNFGTQTLVEPDKINQIEMDFAPTRFYEQISSGIPDKDNTPGLKQRIPKYFDFEFAAIDEDTYYYRDVNAPSTDVVQDKPQYTNVENALGVFGSRLMVSMNTWIKRAGVNKSNTTLERNSQIELAGGKIASDKSLGFTTGKKGFCVEKYLAAGSPADLVCK
jgi:hypothetical protein